MSPLVERGIVRFADLDYPKICKKCLTQLVSSADTRIESDVSGRISLLKDIYSDILDNSKVELDKISVKNGFTLKISSVEDYFEHDTTYTTGRDKRGIVAQYALGDSISREDVVELGVHRRHAELVFSDVVARSVVGERHNIRNHLASSSELALLQGIFGPSSLMAGFNPNFPFICAANLSDLIKIRDNEWHHFEPFRKQVFDAARIIEDGQATANSVMREIVTPRMVEIQKILNTSRRKAGRSIMDNSGIAALAIGSTIVTSGFSGMMAAAVGLIGSGHFAAKMVPALRERFDIPDEVLNDDFYFAYKVKMLFD